MHGVVLSVLLTALMLRTPLFSSDASQLSSAASYAEAGDPYQAQTMLDALADPSMDEWKRRRLAYDTGTAYLYAGDWNSALAKLLPLAAEENPSPLFGQRLAQNIAYARMMEVEELWGKLRQGKNASEEAYYALLIMLGQTLADIGQGRKSLCKLHEAEGGTSCPTSKLYDEMERQTHRLYAAVFEAYTRYRLAHATSQSAVPELLASAKVFKERMQLMQTGGGDPAWQSQYRKDLIAQIESWLPLWEEAGSRWNGAMDKGAYESGFNYYKESFHALGAGDANGAMQAIQKSADSLSALLNTLYKSATPQDAVAILLAAYKLALIKEPMQYSSLSALLEAQKALGPSLKAASNPTAAPLLADAEKYLMKGLDAYRESSYLNARIYTEAAMSFVESLSRQLSPPSKSSGEEVLKQLLSMQEYVSRMTLLRLQSTSKEAALKDIDGLIGDLQKGVVLSARAFPEASIAQQRLIYEDTGAKDDKCQCSPWDEVVPLFDEGYLNARQAAAVLIEPAGRASATLLQEKAIQNWKEALAALHERKPKEIKKQAQQRQEEQPQQEESDLNDVLRYVQEMEQDDRSGPQTVAPMGGRGADRPW